MEQDWADLWRPELAGRISMVDSPREVIGAVLKHMGASYNTQDIHLQVDGGRDAVKQNLALLGKQVLRSNFFSFLQGFSIERTLRLIFEFLRKKNFPS